MQMKQRNTGPRRGAHSLPAARSSAREALAERARPLTTTVAYAIIGLSVAGGFAMSFWPQAVGPRGSNPAIGFGLAALAAFRLYALRQELRRQAADGVTISPAPLRGAKEKRGRF